MACVRRCFQSEKRNFENASRRAQKEKRRGGPLFASRVLLCMRSMKTKFKTSNYQRLRNAGENDWTFKRSYSNDVHKFHAIHGLSPRDQITSARRTKRSWLHTCRACVIATWRLGLRAPLVARNQPAPATQARKKNSKTKHFKNTKAHRPWRKILRHLLLSSCPKAHGTREKFSADQQVTRNNKKNYKMKDAPFFIRLYIM